MSSSQPVFKMLHQKMSYLGAKHAVITKNIASSDIPGYQAEDLKPIDFGKLVNDSQAQNSKLAVTNPLHLSGNSSDQAFSHNKLKDPFETTPVGNNVDITQQVLNLYENSVDYSTTISAYKKMSQLMRIAVGDA